MPIDSNNENAFRIMADMKGYSKIVDESAKCSQIILFVIKKHITDEADLKYITDYLNSNIIYYLCLNKNADEDILSVFKNTHVFEKFTNKTRDKLVELFSGISCLRSEYNECPVLKQVKMIQENVLKQHNII